MLIVKCLIDGKDLVIAAHRPGELPTGEFGQHYSKYVRLPNVEDRVLEALRYICEAEWCSTHRNVKIILPCRHDGPGPKKNDQYFEVFGYYMSNLTWGSVSITFQDLDFDLFKEEFGEPLNGDAELGDFCSKQCWENGNSCCDGYVPNHIESLMKYARLHGYKVEYNPLSAGRKCPFYTKGVGCVLKREHRPHLCRQFACGQARESKAKWYCSKCDVEINAIDARKNNMKCPHCNIKKYIHQMTKRRYLKMQEYNGGVAI